MDSIWTLALMHFPTDDELRRKYYAVKFAESELEETLPTDFVEMEAEVLQKILDEPGKSAFSEIIGQRSRDAFLAGIHLATLYVMYSFPSQFDEPSVRKAIFVVQNLAEQSQYGDGSSIPHSETKIHRCMENFRSVAHLWAALTLHDNFPIREQVEILASPEAVRDFLAGDWPRGPSARRGGSRVASTC